MGAGNVQGKFWSWTIQAGADLSAGEAGTGKRYKAVRSVDGNMATGPLDAIGILQTVGNSGENLTVGWAGVMKFTAAAAIGSADTLLTVNSGGYMAACTSGSYFVGKALYAVASGGIVAGIFNFATPGYRAD